MPDENPNNHNRRTETAKRNDDSEIIDAIDVAPEQGGRSGGDLQRDVGTQAAAERVRDPEAHEGVTKEDKLQYRAGSVEPKAPDGNSPRGGSGG